MKHQDDCSRSRRNGKGSCYSKVYPEVENNPQGYSNRAQTPLLWLRGHRKGEPNSHPGAITIALGVGYEPETDKLCIMMSINFSKKRGKIRTGLDLCEDEIRSNTPNPLTRRALLSQIAAFYNPIGLATPAKQKGVMLVRESYQEAGRDNPTNLG